MKSFGMNLLLHTIFKFCTTKRLFKRNCLDITVSSVFLNYFNFVPRLESRNMDRVKTNCSWDMVLWKNSGGLHSLMRFSKIFQLCTQVRITKCGSREKQLFVSHVFVKKFKRTTHFHEYFKNISNFVLMVESWNADHVKSNCSWDMFLWKKFKRTPHFDEFLKSISTLHPC